MSRLTYKRRAFIEAYFRCGFNATEAARQAGYRHPRRMGSRLTKVDAVREEIEARIRDKIMCPDEVLCLLADQARSRVGDFVGKAGAIKWEAVHDPEKGRLIKRVSHTIGKHSMIELYNAQSALALLGKHLRLFVERQEVSGPEGGPIEHRDVSELTDEERTKRILALLGAKRAEATRPPAADEQGLPEDLPE